jgi:hypothetical protein
MTCIRIAVGFLVVLSPPRSACRRAASDLSRLLAVLLIALVPPAAAVAQNLAADQQYCAALLDKYLRYAGVTEYPGTPGKLSNDNQAALAQARCQAGDTNAGIAILERKLRDAKLDPPPRS